MHRSMAFWEPKKSTTNIQKHAVLNDIQFNEQNEWNDSEDSSKINDIILKDENGNIIESLSLDTSTPDTIIKEYKWKHVSVNEVAEALQKYEQRQANIAKKISDLWWEWIQWTYTSMHGWHYADRIVPKWLVSDTTKKYYTKNDFCLLKDCMSHVGDFWDKSIFISGNTMFGINTEKEFYYFNIPTSLRDWKSSLHEYQGNLLLSHSNGRFMNSWQDNSLKVVVDSNGVLSEELFTSLKTVLSETRNWFKDMSEGILNL